MNIVSNLPRVTFFFYLFYIYYSYVRPVPEVSIVRDVASTISDYGVHFIAFFALGALAQLSNNKSNNFIFGISLALITSAFIEFIHFILPFRDFVIMEGFANIVGCVLGIYLINYIRSKYV